MCSRLAAESWLARATAVLRDCVFGGRSAKDHLHDDRQPRRPPEWARRGRPRRLAACAGTAGGFWAGQGSLRAVSTNWIPAFDTAATDFTDIRYERSAGEDEGIAKITIDRPEVRNAFRPRTIIEISRALEHAREDTRIGVVVLTGEGPDAFCSGGDQRVRGDSGYLNDDDAGSGRRGALSRHRPAHTDPAPAQAGRGDGRRVRDRRRPCAAPRMRPDDRGGQRPLRPGRAEGRIIRRGLRGGPAREPRRAQEGKGDLVPVPAVLGAGGARDGHGQHRRPA